jgi:curved DNA-binding protein CbpA
MDSAFAAEVEALAAALDQLDYFGVLKLPRTAGLAEVKAAYYRESRAYHPDRYAAHPDPVLRERVGRIYRRINEAYTVLRDDRKRVKYVQDVTGPERAQKLRFTEASDAESKAAAKKEHEEQIGTHPKGRSFYQLGAADLDAGRWSSAERNLKMALTYEPGNARSKEKLTEAQKKLNEESKAKGEAFKIK